MSDFAVWITNLDPNTTMDELRQRAATDAAARRVFQTMTVNELLFGEFTTKPPAHSSGPMATMDTYLESVRTALEVLGAADERVVSEGELLERVGGDVELVRRAVRRLVEGSSILEFQHGAQRFYSAPRRIRAGWPGEPTPIDPDHVIALMSAVTGEPLDAEQQEGVGPQNFSNQQMLSD